MSNKWREWEEWQNFKDDRGFVTDTDEKGCKCRPPGLGLLRLYAGARVQPPPACAGHFSTQSLKLGGPDDAPPSTPLSHSDDWCGTPQAAHVSSAPVRQPELVIPDKEN